MPVFKQREPYPAGVKLPWVLHGIGSAPCGPLGEALC